MYRGEKTYHYTPQDPYFGVQFPHKTQRKNPFEYGRLIFFYGWLSLSFVFCFFFLGGRSILISNYFKLHAVVTQGAASQLSRLHHCIKVLWGVTNSSWSDKLTVFLTLLHPPSVVLETGISEAETWRCRDQNTNSKNRSRTSRPRPTRFKNETECT